MTADVKITKELLNNYANIQKVIERDEKKLRQYEDNPPMVEYGKVVGSNPNFPYEQRSFTISGFNIGTATEWEQRVRELTEKLRIEKEYFARVTFAIDMLILKITNPRDKLVFEYLYRDGLTQQQVADMLYIDQSVVSRTIAKYVPE